MSEIFSTKALLDVVTEYIVNGWTFGIIHGDTSSYFEFVKLSNSVIQTHTLTGRHIEAHMIKSVLSGTC